MLPRSTKGPKSSLHCQTVSFDFILHTPPLRPPIRCVTLMWKRTPDWARHSIKSSQSPIERTAIIGCNWPQETSRNIQKCLVKSDSASEDHLPMDSGAVVKSCKQHCGRPHLRNHPLPFQPAHKYLSFATQSLRSLDTLDQNIESSEIARPSIQASSQTARANWSRIALPSIDGDWPSNQKRK